MPCTKVINNKTTIIIIIIIIIITVVTQAVRQSKSMKWTDEIHIFIVRSYYRITETEIDIMSCRHQLYREFIENMTTERRLHSTVSIRCYHKEPHDSLKLLILRLRLLMQKAAILHTTYMSTVRFCSRKIN